MTTDASPHGRDSVAPKGVGVRLFSYKQTDDTGFAPNPFHGVCTLATCKADMRLKKRVGDWIAGFTSAGLNGDPVGEERLIYLMQVAAKVTFDEYYRAPEFAEKIPPRGATGGEAAVGDNIYYLEGGSVRQVRNISHGSSLIDDDARGEYVLVGRRFYYFGSKPLVVPRTVRPTIPTAQAGSGWLTHDKARAKAFIDFVDARGQGVHAPPHDLPGMNEGCRRR